MYAPENLKVGQAVVSRMGHDKERVYLIVAECGTEFVLCVDGKYRTTDNPKMKRRKHLKYAGDAVQVAECEKLTDAAVRKILTSYRTDTTEK